MSRDRAIRARASVPRADSSMVKKALSWTLLGSAGPRQSRPLASRTACRSKAPRVGARSASSRRSSAARPSRGAHRASVCCAGGSALLPRRSGQGKERFSRQEVPGAIKVGAKSLPGAIPVGRVEARCSSTPVPVKLWWLPDRNATFGRSRQSSQRRIPVVRDVRSGPWSCSWKHPLAEVVRAHAALKAHANSVRTRV